MHRKLISGIIFVLLFIGITSGCVDIAFETNVGQSSQTAVQTIAPGPAPASTKTSVPGPVLMDANFDDRKSPGFFFESGDWEFVVAEKDTNTVLSVANHTGASYIPAQARFGLETWQDYTVDFRFKVIATAQVAPPVSLFFRKSGQGSFDEYYVLSFAQEDEIYLGYTSRGNPWTKLDAKSFTPLLNAWYAVRVEANNEKISIYVDGFPYFTVTDAQFDQGDLMLSVGQGTFAQFDDIRVVALGPEE